MTKILDKYPRTEKNTKSDTTTGKVPIIDVKADKKAKTKSGQRRPVASEAECMALW